MRRRVMSEEIPDLPERDAHQKHHDDRPDKAMFASGEPGGEASAGTDQAAATHRADQLVLKIPQIILSINRDCSLDDPVKEGEYQSNPHARHDAAHATEDRPSETPGRSDNGSFGIVHDLGSLQTAI